MHAGRESSQPKVSVGYCLRPGTPQGRVSRSPFHAMAPVKVTRLGGYFGFLILELEV